MQIDATLLAKQSDFVVALQADLPFPPWCGPSMDSMRDAFPELVESLPFPVMVFLRRFDVLANVDLPLAGQLIDFGTAQSYDFGMKRKVFRVHYCLDG